MLRNLGVKTTGETVNGLPSPGAALLLLASLLPMFLTDVELRGDDTQLDLVITIDVSGSMYSQNGRRWEGRPGTSDKLVNADYPVDGSDPLRIRWDAAELALHLLSHDDRVAILRFNSFCPARLPQSCNYPFREFPSLLQPVGEVRNSLLETIRLHNRDDDVAEVNGYPIRHILDIGGTNLREALRVSCDCFEKSPSGRRRHVILLTDGMDELMGEARPPATRGANEAKYRQELTKQLKRFQDGQVVVHVLGLNLKALQENQDQARGELLRIATQTEGSYHDANDAAQLLCVFRDLIRDLKHYWSRSETFSKGTINIPVAPGVKDLGILLHRATPDVRDPAKFPITAPKLANKERWNGWISGGGDPPRLARRIAWGWKRPDLPDRGLSTYLSVGDAADGSGSEFRFLQKRTELLVDLSPGQAAVEGTIFQRLNNEPFSYNPDLSRATLCRWDRLPIVVWMKTDAAKGLQPESFEIRANWRTRQQPSPDPCSHSSTDPGHEVILQPVPVGETGTGLVAYRGELHLDALSQPGVGNYELIVSIEAKPKAPVLSGLKRQFPPTAYAFREDTLLSLKADVLQVENSVRRERLEFRQNETLEVRLSPEFREQGIAGELPVEFEVIPPQDDRGRPLPTAFLFVTGEADELGNDRASSGKGTFTLASSPNSQALGQLRLKFLDSPENEAPLSRPAAFTGGKLVIRSAGGERGQRGGTERLIGNNRRIKPLELDLRVNLELIPMEIEGEIGDLSNRERRVSGPLRVSRTDESQGTLGPIQVELVPQGNDDRPFPMEELWLARAPADTDTGGAQKLVDLRLDEEFRIHFKTASTTPTRSRFELRVTAPGGSCESRSFAVAVEPWVVTMDPDRLTLEGAPGQRIDCPLRVAGSVPEGERLAVWIPSPTTWKFSSGEARLAGKANSVKRSGAETPLLVNLPAEAQPFLLRSTGAGDRLEDSLNLQLQIPDDCPCGLYETELFVLGENLETVTIPVQVIVDRLDVKLLLPTGDFVWKDDVAIPIRQKLRTPFEVQLVFRRGSGLPFSADREPAVSATAPRGGGHQQPAPIWKSGGLNSTATEYRGVLTLRAPATALETVYDSSLRAELPFSKESQNRGQHRREREFKVYIFDPTKHARPQPPAPAPQSPKRDR